MHCFVPYSGSGHEVISLRLVPRILPQSSLMLLPISFFLVRLILKRFQEDGYFLQDLVEKFLLKNYLKPIPCLLLLPFLSSPAPKMVS